MGCYVIHSILFSPRVKNICYNRRDRVSTKDTLSYFFLGVIPLLENRFKTKLIREIEDMFPGCIVVHLDPNEIQGIPDLLILYRNKWAALEGKKTANSPHRPNQDYYIDLMNDMSFAAFIYPENKEEVLDELQQALRPTRSARLSKR